MDNIKNDKYRISKLLNDIDFVITWVDGNDKKWQAEKAKYSKEKVNDSIRYRDWENLQYWFRAVEKFAPWVRKIHFITYGHIPSWLDTNNPKIHIVNHADFIPKKYLPTFNSRVIELNMHKIPDLSEHFVYFNDDMFINKPVTKNDFFNNGMPKDIGVLQPVIYGGIENTFAHMRLNNTRIINNYFSKTKMLRDNLFKWVNLKYGFYGIRNIFFSIATSKYPGFIVPHIPTSYLKSTFETVWNKEEKILDRTCTHKFRDNTDVNHFLMQYWQLVSGNFYPRNIGIGKYLSISNNNKELVETIISKKYKLICLNDVDKNIDFEKSKKEIQNAFEIILPKKSTFEK